MNNNTFYLSLFILGSVLCIIFCFLGCECNKKISNICIKKSNTIVQNDNTQYNNL